MDKPESGDAENSADEVADLRARLEEAEETLRAIRAGEVDALTVTGVDGEQVFTLQGAEHPYRIMVETMSEGALVVTADGLIVFSNHRFGVILKEPISTIVGASIFSYVQAVDRERLSTLCAEGRKKSATGEIPLICRDGTTVRAHLALSPLNVESLRGVCIVVMDLTERTQMEEAIREQDALKQAKATAEAANRAKDEFIAKLSHELRTPLTPVLAAISDMEKQELLSKETQSDVEMIRRNVDLEVTLIDDLLDVTRISRGILELHLVVVDVHTCILTAVEICTTEIEAKGLKLSLDEQAGRHHVWADPTRLRQVFWNLLSNAVKFTPRGGSIRLHTEDAADRIRVVISDTGIGIEPEFLPRIFDAFEQGTRIKSGYFGGLGLGMSIAKAIVEMHHGSILAFSKGRDHGATFTVEVATVESAEAVPPAPIVLDERNSLRILLVEDHRDTMRILAKLLRRWGHAVTTADCSRSALERMPEQSYDLLVSDLGLPDGSGLDVMRRAKQNHGLPGIALSGYGTAEDRCQSRDAGFDEHLVKPVDSGALQRAIQRVGKSGNLSGKTRNEKD